MQRTVRKRGKRGRTGDTTSVENVVNFSTNMRTAKKSSQKCNYAAKLSVNAINLGRKDEAMMTVPSAATFR